MVLAGLAAGFRAFCGEDGSPGRAERRPPPFFLSGAKWKGFLTVAWQDSDAKAHRENEEDLRDAPCPHLSPSENQSVFRTSFFMQPPLRNSGSAKRRCVHPQ